MDVNKKVEVLHILLETLIQQLIEDGVINSEEYDTITSNRIDKLLKSESKDIEQPPIFLTNIIGET
jgi:ribosomal protein L19E